MKYILIITLLFFTTETNAQFGKRLKDRATEVAERKANQKADEAINKGIDKVDSVITGKKRTKTSNTKTESETTESPADNTNTSKNETGSGSVETTYKEVIIKTNIRCETGKKKLENILRDTDGVSSVLIDNDNGNVYLSSDNPDVPAKVTELIRQNGFEAAGKKPTKVIPNPCK
jgi:hypothetical protein